MNKFLWVLTNISAVMFGLGLGLPFIFGFFLNGYNWPVIVWDILQIGGLLGLVIFGSMYRLTKAKNE